MKCMELYITKSICGVIIDKNTKLTARLEQTNRGF